MVIERQLSTVTQFLKFQKCSSLLGFCDKEINQADHQDLDTHENGLHPTSESWDHTASKTAPGSRYNSQ